MIRQEKRSFDDGRGGQVSAVAALPANFLTGRSTGVMIAHGAGNDMQHPFIGAVHEGLAARGFLAVKFNFPYKERGGRAPDPSGVLEDCYRSVVDAVRSDPTLRPGRLFLAGKSLGGRIASHLAAARVITDGLIFLGYPLHPAGQPGDLRVAHLPKIHAPMLFFAGTRDPLCRFEFLRKAVGNLERPLHPARDRRRRPLPFRYASVRAARSRRSTPRSWT